MTRSLSPLLRLAVAVLLLSPSFASVEAAAQVVNAAAVSGASAVSAVAGAAIRAPLALGAMPMQAPSLTINFAPSPLVVPALAPSALNSFPAASQAAPALEAAPAASARTIAAAPAATAISVHSVAPSDAPAVRGSMTAALTGVFRTDSKTAVAPSVAEGRIDVLFDGGTANRAVDDSAPVAAGLPALSAASVLDKSVPAASSAVKAVPSAAAAGMKRAGRSFAVKALIVAAIMLATPGIALAATTAGPIVATAAASLSFLAGIQPIAAAVGALAGAIYGMFAARPKDGSSASSGDVFSSILRYGVLGGAGAYILLDLSQIATTGVAAIGLKPLTSAIAIAALGRTAFQDKFMAPTTTSADRIMGAFPAVAAAVGISVGIGMSALVAPALPLSFVLATGAMAVTGVATALYAAIFKPGQSLINGPERMAKGYVLQALMMGLALAMTNPYLFWSFAIMGAGGFGLVLWTTALEIWAHRPGAPAQPLPPVIQTPPVTPVPPVTPAPPGTTPPIKPVGV
jgi:hypothetical protein